MPIARYFLFVGAMLLALLFAVDGFAPKDAVVSSAVSATENPTLRIRSDHKWPEPVVYDTSLPTIVPPKVEIAAALPAPDFGYVGQVSGSRVLCAVQAGRPVKPEAKPVPKRKIAKARAAPPVVRVAQQPQFGFFASNFW